MSQKDRVARIAAYNDRTNPISRLWSAEALLHLRHAWNTCRKDNEELWDFFPIRIVTTLEIFFRSWIKEFVDHGAPYVKNAADLAKDAGLKFDYAVSEALVGRRVSLGDLIAHSVSFNAVEQLSSNMTKLIGEDYFSSLANVHDRTAVELASQPATPIISDLGMLKARIARLYLVRNIVTHESPKMRPYSEADVDGFLDASSALIKASQERFSFLLHGNYPLTQLAMNLSAADTCAQAKRELDELYERMIETSDSPELRASQEAWEKYAELAARFHSGIDQPGHGSIAPMLYSAYKGGHIRSRIRELEGGVGLQEAEL